MPSSRHCGNTARLFRYWCWTLIPIQVTVAGSEIKLTTREFTLLKTLLGKVGRVLSRERLGQALYGWDDSVESNAVEVHIHNLRRKLSGFPIRTVRGVGYMIPPEQGRRP